MQHDFQDKSGRPTRKDSSGHDCKDIAAYMVRIVKKLPKTKNLQTNIIVAFRTTHFHPTPMIIPCQTSGLDVQMMISWQPISFSSPETEHTAWKKEFHH